jgi:hypothetical protein
MHNAYFGEGGDVQIGDVLEDDEDELAFVGYSDDCSHDETGKSEDLKRPKKLVIRWSKNYLVWRRR